MHGSITHWTVISFIAVRTLLAAGNADAVGWSERTLMTVPRQEVAVAELDGSVFVIGGFREDASVANTVEVYNPVADSWTEAAPVPIPLHHAAAVTVDGKLYLVGGCRQPFIPLATLFEYDPGSDSWIQRASMPAPRCSLAVASLDGRIYAAGGSPPAREQDFSVYDPALDQWTALADMPTGRNHLAAGAAGGKFYAIGGRSGGITSVLSVVEEYDPIAGLWLTKTPMPTARGGVASAMLENYIVVFGGEGNPTDPDGVFEAVEAYDSNTDSWISLPSMPTPRHGIGAAKIAQSVYMPGGASNQGLGVTNVHEVFDATAIGDFIGVYCDAMMSQSSYGVGDEVVISKLRIANLVEQSVKVELKAWYDLMPSVDAVSVLNLGATGSLVLPPGVDVDLAPISLFPVTSGTEPGSYRLGCRTLNQVTGEGSSLDVNVFDVLVP